MDSKKFKNLDVYFSASSSELDERKHLYSSILKSIKQLEANLTYNWLEDKKKLSPEEIFVKATEGIKNADVVVAEITYPSIGVGQQIGLALSWKTPVIALHQKGSKQVSRFAMGMESPYLQIVEYSEEDLTNTLADSFASLSSIQIEKFNFISTKEINDYLETMSRQQNISRSQYLRRIVREWISKNPLD